MPATPARAPAGAPWSSPAEYKGMQSAPAHGPPPTKFEKTDGFEDAGKATEYDGGVAEYEEAEQDEGTTGGNQWPMYYIPNPAEILPMPPATGRKKYYVVTTGQDVGVFNDW